ncbi:MAG: hypothetical protein GXY23_05845 [Myxococcales bacterium]|jgi:hypothetical protein|nr:hypothetical protein [Myxococcales bacterium]
MTTSRRLLLLSLLTALVACDKAPTPPARSTSDAPEAKTAPKAKDEVVDAPSSIERGTYKLALTRIEGADDAQQAFEVSLQGVGEWHVNTEYPIAVTIAADGAFSPEKARLDREDAATLSDDVARFVFVARKSSEAAEGRVNAHVKFAMCIPTSCTFHDETLGYSLREE